MVPGKSTGEVLPKISSGQNSAHKQQIVGGTDKPQTQLMFQQKQESYMPNQISAEFEVYHMQHKRPSRRQIRRVSKNQQKMIDDRVFLQKLAMNYYGSRPQNYLSKAENKTLKSHQVTALMYKKGSIQNYVQSKTIGANRMHREHKKRSRYFAEDTIAGRSKNKRKSATEDEEAAEILRLKQQIQSEKEKVVAYWQMLHENVKLNDDELAQIIKDLSDFESDDEELPAGDNSLTRNEDPTDIDQLEQEKNFSILNTVKQPDIRLQEQALDMMLPRQKIPVHDVQQSLAHQQQQQLSSTDHHHQQVLTIKRNKSTPFPRNMSNQKSKDRYKNDILVQKVQLPSTTNPPAQQVIKKDESVTILTSYNPYKSTTPRTKKRNISQHETATSKRISDNNNALSNNSNTGEVKKVNNVHHGALSQSKRKTSVAAGIPLKQLKSRTNESNADLTQGDHFNQSQYSHQQPQQRVLISSMATQNNMNQSHTTYISGQKSSKVPQTQSQLDHYKQPRRNLKQHLTPVQLNKKSIEQAVPQTVSNNDPSSNVTSPNPIKMQPELQQFKNYGDTAVYQLPQLKRDQIHFAKKELNSPQKITTNDMAKLYKSQDNESLKIKEQKVKKQNTQSIQPSDATKALTPKLLKTGKPMTSSDTHLLEQKLTRPTMANQNQLQSSHRNNLRYNDDSSKSQVKLKLKYAIEVAKESSDVALRNIGAGAVLAPVEEGGATGQPNRDSQGQMQSLAVGHANVNNLMIVDEQSSQAQQKAGKPKFVKNKNGSVHDDQKTLPTSGAAPTSHFNDMYNSLGPYGSQKDSNNKSKSGKNRTQRKELLENSIQLATQSIDESRNMEAPQQLQRDKSQHIASDLLLNRLKIHDHQLLNQRERDKLRAQSKCRVRKMMEENVNRTAKPSDYVEQGQPIQTKMESYLQKNQTIRSKRLNKNASHGQQLQAQSTQVGQGTSLYRLVEEARLEKGEESDINDDSSARQLERQQVCSLLLDTQKELKNFNMDIDAKFLEKDQTFFEMFHGNVDAIPGYNIPYKQKQVQAIQNGRDTIEVYTSYLKNLTRSIQHMLGYQDRDNEQTKKFQSDMQPDGVRKMLVQIRNQVHPDSQEVKMFDEVKKLIHQDKPEKKGKEKEKEKKKKFYSMHVIQMQEHHQTIQVQIRNDIIGTNRPVNKYFYQNVEQQWPREPIALGLKTKTKKSQALSKEKIDINATDLKQNDEAVEEQNLELMVQFDHESQKNNEVPSGDEEPLERLESNSPIFNEQFLRQTLSQDVRYDSDERQNSEHLSEDQYEDMSDSQAEEDSKKDRSDKYVSKSNSQIYSMQIDNHQDQIDDVRMDMVDNSVFKRTKSFCQQNESLDHMPNEIGLMDQKRSLVVHEILHTQDIAQSLSSQDNYLSDQELHMPTTTNRTNPNQEESAILAHQRASNQELVSYHLNLESLTEKNKMNQTQDTFMKLSKQAQSQINNKKITEFTSKQHLERSHVQPLDEGTNLNSRSETAMNTTKNLFNAKYAHIVENQEEQSLNQNLDTNVTQRNWLLPKINVEGNSSTIEKIEKEQQQQELKSIENKTIQDDASLPRIVLNESLDVQENQSIEGHQTSLSFLNTSLQAQTVLNEYQNNSYANRSRQQRPEQVVRSSKSEMQQHKPEQDEDSEKRKQREQTVQLNDSQLDIFIKDYQKTAPLVEADQHQNAKKLNPIAQINHQSILTKFNLNSKLRKAEITSMLDSIQQMPNNKSLRVKQSQQKHKNTLQKSRSKKILNAELDKVLQGPDFLPNAAASPSKQPRPKPNYNSVERISWHVKQGGTINMYIPTNMQINKSSNDVLYSLDAQQTLQALRFKNLGHYSHNYSQKSQNNGSSHRSYVTVGPYSKPELLNQSGMPLLPNHSQHSPSSIESKNNKKNNNKNNNMEARAVLNRNADIAVPAANLISKQIKRLRQRSTIMDKTNSPPTLDTQLYQNSAEVVQQ